jgi:hypothetical protein
MVLRPPTAPLKRIPTRNRVFAAKARLSYRNSVSFSLLILHPLTWRSAEYRVGARKKA